MQELYYFEKEFQKQHHRWTTNTVELRLPARAAPDVAQAPSIRLTPEGFSATVALKPKDGPVQLWHIRQDARVWKD